MRDAGWVWDASRKTGRLLGHFAGGAIAIELTITVGWRLWDR